MLYVQSILILSRNYDTADKLYDRSEADQIRNKLGEAAFANKQKTFKDGPRNASREARSTKRNNPHEGATMSRATRKNSSGCQLAYLARMNGRNQLFS